MLKSVSTPPESGVDALKVVLTHLVCQHLLESGVDARQQLKKVVLTQVCQQCVNVETRPTALHSLLFSSGFSFFSSYVLGHNHENVRSAISYANVDRDLHYSTAMHTVTLTASV